MKPTEPIFPFGSQFPASALEAGADVVIQSLHKTPAVSDPDGGAACKRGLVDVDRLEHYLQIYQSSSPSYVFMAAMERCVSYMNGEGRRRMDAFNQRILALRRELEDMRCLRLLDASAKGTYGNIRSGPFQNRYFHQEGAITGRSWIGGFGKKRDWKWRCARRIR